MPAPMAVISAAISSWANILSGPSLLNVEDFALERKDGLELPIAALLGRSAGGLAFYDVELGSRRISSQ